MRLPQSVLEDLFEPDPARFIPRKDLEPYEYLVIDGGGLITTAWSTHRSLELADQRVRAAVYVFVTTLAGLSRLVSQDARVIVAWDGVDNRAWRRGIHPWYKHGRGTMIARAEVRAAMTALTPLLQAIGIGIVEIPGREADDVVATLARVISLEKEKNCLIFSDDRDYIQLISDRVHLGRRSLDGVILTPEYCSIMDTPWGLDYLYIKALMGDAGDNIRGISGIGEVKARALIWTIPDFIETAMQDPSLIDWSLLDPTLKKAFVRGGEELVMPGKYPQAEWLKEWLEESGMEMPTLVEAPEEDKLEAVAVAAARFFKLVELDRKVDLPKFVFPAVNIEMIPGALRRLDLSDEDDLVSSLYTLARMRNPNLVPPRRAAARVGGAF